MGSLFGVFIVVLIINYSFALTETEIEAINSRNNKRGSCSGYMKATTESDNSVKIERDITPDHDWGCSNPNPPQSQAETATLPNEPVELAEGEFYCLSEGDIGIALNGVSFYHPLAAGNRNAVEGKCKEEFDCCEGHSSPDGKYHYHQLPMGDGCNNPIFNSDDQAAPQFLGVAMDGYPIYGQWTGLDKDSLDECHGTTLSDGRYAYFAVRDDFPYIMGCFKAKPVGVSSSQTCEGIKPGQLCSCEAGILNFDDVTESDDKMNKRSLVSKNYWRRLLYKILDSQKRQDVDENCYGHSNLCALDKYSYSSGQCICSGDDCLPDSDCFGGNMRPGNEGNGGNMRPDNEGNMIPDNEGNMRPNNEGNTRPDNEGNMRPDNEGNHGNEGNMRPDMQNNGNEGNPYRPSHQGNGGRPHKGNAGNYYQPSSQGNGQRPPYDMGGNQGYPSPGSNNGYQNMRPNISNPNYGGYPYEPQNQSNGRRPSNDMRW